MAYPAPPGAGRAEPSEADVREFLLDVGARKEFRALLPGGPRGPPLPAHPYAFGMPGGPDAPPAPAVAGLRLHGAQLFVEGFFSPDTPYTRLVLNWQTGTGKSIGVAAIALEHARRYRALAAPPAERPSVFVVGFTRAIIQAELLRHPEFGFVSPAEVAELGRLRAAAGAGGPAEGRQYAGLLGVLRRRLTDRARGGYFRFYGYKEFAGRLLTVTRRGAARGFSAAGLFRRREGGADAGADADAEPGFLERIDAAVAAGDLEVDRELLGALRGGLVVADEIHNTYNLQAKNNYGVALQYALDRLEAEEGGGAAAPRAVFMSATLTGGAAPEVVDLLNFLVPPAARGGRPLRRAEFFRAEGPRRRAALLPGALARIGRLSAGRVSFLLDADEGAYPRQVFEGAPLPDPLRPGADIPFLRFTPCPMSPFHERTLARALADRGDFAAAAAGGLPANAYALYDMAFPNPEYGPAAAADDPAAVGLYLAAETPARLAAAPPDWRAAAGVTVGALDGGVLRAGVPALIGGPFLALAPSPGGPPGLGAYSAKLAAVAARVLEAIRGGPGKVLVYHHRVRMSGVLAVQEALEANGLIDEASAPAPGTLCGVCGAPRRDHSAAAAGASWAGPHEYTPARYAVATNEVERGALERSLARFDSQTNLEGFEVRVLVGSKMIREGLNFVAVRHLLVASLPDDVSTLIQVFGRVRRRGSHRDLPEGQRDVATRIFVSTAGPLSAGRGPAPEVERYADKVAEYALVQEVERELRRNAVDAFVNREQMLAADPPLLAAPGLLGLPYSPAVAAAEVRAAPERTATFYAYGFGDREVATLRAVILALFEVRPVWTFGDLWDAARSGRVGGVAQDPASFTAEGFALALEGLAYHPPGVSAPAGGPGGPPWLVARAGPFFLRAPAGPGGRPVLDVESYLRDAPPLAPLRLRVADYVQTARRATNFAVRLGEFEEEFAAADAPVEEALARYDAEFHYALLRALVEGAAGAGGDLAAGVARRAAAPGSPLARAAALYSRFRVLVSAADLAGAPEARRLVRALRLPRAPAAPLGFVAEGAVRLFGDAESPDGWYDIPRKALGVGLRHAENDVAVGYVERRGAHLRFKVRPPLHVLEASGVRDVRSLARGAACETRPRAEQEDLAVRLKVPAGGGRPPKNAADLAGLNSAEICAGIRRRLLALEEAARARKNGMLDGTRWFYLFNDRLPTVTLVRR